MIFTKEDKQLIQGIANTQDKKEVIVRMFVAALMQGTNVTAPEMRNCTQIVINSLKEVETSKPKNSRKNEAV